MWGIQLRCGLPVLLIGWLVFICGGQCAGESLLSCVSGDCEACHGAQASQAAVGAADSSSNINPSSLMLRGSDPGSTCLICHQAPASAVNPQGHYTATSDAALRSYPAPSQLTPGGDYGWLKRDYRWQGEHGRMDQSMGERHGHNIVANDFNFRADTTLQSAPGGAYPASALSCISCHDPHGNYRRLADGSISTTGPAIIGSGSYNDSPDPDGSGSVRSYRMLAGKGYQPRSLAASEAFVADPPAAVAPKTYNRSESATDTRVAYGSGMSEWCRNCHTSIHSEDRGTGGHPAGNGARLSQTVAAIYNGYVKSGDLSGASDRAYTSMVPFEMGTNNYAVLKGAANSNSSYLSGPEGGEENVMCLSCHRAHASGWDSAMRWNVKATFLVYDGNYPGMDNGAPAQYAQGRTEQEVRAAFYGRPASIYARWQRSLCNKCHSRD